MIKSEKYPVAVIGAGPVGLAAAAHLVQRGLTPLIFERGTEVGAAVRAWGHVRLFSPWRYTVDSAARDLLIPDGWVEPDPEGLPTGAEIVERYLAPLAANAAIVPGLHLGTTVTAITRNGLDKMSSRRRNETPFAVHWRTAEGEETSTLVSAVIDASGTWNRPNPIGVDGRMVSGEQTNAARIAYGIPDILGSDRGIYAGKSTLVVGGGHSAIQSALALLSLRQHAPGTRILWALRQPSIARLLGGGLADRLPERGALGLAADRAIASGAIEVLAPFAAHRIDRKGNRLAIEASADGQDISLSVDRFIVATGFRPDLEMLRELRVAIDPAVEAPPALAPLIDPNLHSCGTVPPHGVDELTHPEPGFFIVGSKSYGRAPTFLMATGYEQVRSVVAELAGDPIAARQVHLVLPETGVCSVPQTLGLVDAGQGCCGGPAVDATNACCAADEAIKSVGGAGCGCATAEVPAKQHEHEPA